MNGCYEASPAVFRGFATWCPVDDAPNISKQEPGAEGLFLAWCLRVQGLGGEFAARGTRGRRVLRVVRDLGFRGQMEMLTCYDSTIAFPMANLVALPCCLDVSQTDPEQLPGFFCGVPLRLSHPRSLCGIERGFRF